MKYQSGEQIEVPTPCPKCGGKMICIMWKAVIEILRQRSWLSCLECTHQEPTEDWKERLLTV